MTEKMLKDLREDFETLKKEAQEIEKRLSDKENDEALNRELSVALFKCALCEGIINREEEKD